MIRKAIIIGNKAPMWPHCCSLRAKGGCHQVPRLALALQHWPGCPRCRNPRVSTRNFVLQHGDLPDSTNLFCIIEQVQPDEIYKLATISDAARFETTECTANAHDISGKLMHVSKLPSIDWMARLVVVA